VRVQQDVRLFASLLEGGESVQHTIGRGRKGWLHVVSGTVELNDTRLRAGDGVAIDGEEILAIRSRERGEILLFDMTA
jgi:redox-sensitive bicupin YhaK (pirin superfamily)